ncbi:MAG: sulfatase [Candidatus Omnitrophica bacterium]|nr:sulfatase [Candidatus Omnitrophota bacterium]
MKRRMFIKNQIIVKIILIISLFFSTVIVGHYLIYLKKSKQPNVILITIDSLRPDHLSCYGYKRNTSPNIDSLAKEGVIFTHAITQAPFTVSSVSSFITSSYPYMNLVNLEQKEVYLNTKVSTLPFISERNGYKTAVFTDHFIIGQPVGLNTDSANFTQIKKNSPDRLTQLSLKWLRENKNRKFFLWIYYYGAHYDYKPSLPYSDIFFNDGLFKIHKNIPISTGIADGIFGVIPKNIAENNITDVNYYIARYDGKIRIIDDQIGLLLQEVKKIDLDKNTVIILIADHGESLGEHNLYFNHGYDLYDELIKVPLIIRYPNSMSKNKIIDCQVQLIDVMPTILDILNIKTKNIYMQGRSLMPYILGEKCYTQKYAFSEIAGSIFCIRSENYKLIYVDRESLTKIPLPQIPHLLNYYSDEYYLYDLKNDHFETHNLIYNENILFENLKQELNKYINKAKYQALENKKPVQKHYIKDKTIGYPNEETKEEMKSLGYAQ